MEQTKGIKEFLLQEEDSQAIEERYSSFFATAGAFFDSLDYDDISDDTHDMLDSLLDVIIDTILSCGDEEFDEKTEKAFMKIVDMLQLDKTVKEAIEEGLAVKSRKVNIGRKKSQSSRMTGSSKIKYLKSLRKGRKTYKRNASLRRTTKRKSKRYRKTAGAKFNRRKYKAIHKK